MRITVLGGYGNAGIEIARLASRFTGHTLIVAGRNADRAQSAASDLSDETGTTVEWMKCDAAVDGDLIRAVQSGDLLLVASSTIELTEPIATACLEAGTKYFDIGLSNPEKWRVLRTLETRIVNAGLTFVTDGGFHPGLPGVLIRYAAAQLPDIQTAYVAGSFALDWSKRTFSPSTETEFALEIRDAALAAWEDGSWVTGYRHSREFDFGDLVGRRRCIPMMMQEVLDVVEATPSLRHAGFFISGFGPVVDYCVMPVCMLGLSLGPRMQRLSGRLFMWGLERFASSSERAVLRLEASTGSDGDKKDLVVTVSHDDPYVLTAAPVVSCLRQLDTTDARIGLYSQADFLDPVQTFRDLDEMGIVVEGAE